MLKAYREQWTPVCRNRLPALKEIGLKRFVAAALFAACVPAFAQAPRGRPKARQVRQQLPAGGAFGPDRALGRDVLQKQFNQPFVVENKAAPAATSAPTPSPRRQPMATRCCSASTAPSR
jgi:hypothetical protein